MILPLSFVVAFIATTTTTFVYGQEDTFNGPVCQVSDVAIFIENGEERVFSCDSKFEKPYLLWEKSDDDDDEYHVEARDADQNVFYKTDEVDGGSSGSLDSLPLSNSYQVVYHCDNEWDDCDYGHFSYKIIDCGCPAGTDRVQECSNGAVSSARSAVCKTIQPTAPEAPEAPKLSTEKVSGRWIQTASGPNFSYSISVAHSTTESTEVTQSQAAEFFSLCECWLQFRSRIGRRAGDGGGFHRYRPERYQCISNRNHLKI